jgi:hypothetical protein
MGSNPICISDLCAVSVEGYMELLDNLGMTITSV